MTTVNMLRRRFDRAAAGFDSADFVHRATGDGLLERLAPMIIEARHVLDLGAATGSLSRQLAKRFRGSQVVSLDLAHDMLAAARRRRWRFSRLRELQADSTALPLAEGSIDVVTANQLLPLLPDPERCFAEIARVLRRDGVFAFATLGPDSLAELRAAWGATSGRFADMHDIGDALVRAGLRDPVLDVDRLVVEYRQPADLYRELAAAGAREPLAGSRQGLSGRVRYQKATARLRDPADGVLRLRLELVYGHAFGGGPRPPAGEQRIDATAIGLRARGRAR